MTQTEALRLALEALEAHADIGIKADKAITAIKAALEAKDEPYAFKASMYSNDRMKVDVVTGNVSIGTVKKPCGLECDCTDVCKQDDYKALWQQMCERCDELDKKLAHLEAKDEPVAWKWHQAPVKTSWGDGMVVADIAIDKDHTASIYCERDQTAKVEAMFTPPQRKPLMDEEILTYRYMIDWTADWSYIKFARAIEAAHGITGDNT